MKICKVEKCEGDAGWRKKGALGYCGKHYLQQWRHGKILERTRYDSNKIIDCEDHCEICLYNIKNKEVARTKIDKDDLEKIKKYKWGLNSYGYAKVNLPSNKCVFLHLLIKPSKEGYEIDHIDGNPLNNRKYNLRNVTHQQNLMNQKKNKNNISGYKGVYLDKRRDRWYAEIRFNKKIFLGYFTNKKDAANARKEAEIKYFGEFRRK